MRPYFRIALLAAVIQASTGFSPVAAQRCDQCLSQVPPNCKFDPFERAYRVYGCRAEAIASWEGVSNPPKTSSCVANPPSGTYLIDLIETRPPPNNGGATVSRYASGLDFNYEKTVRDAYETALDLAGKSGDFSLESRIKDEYKRTLEIIEKTKTNADTVRVEVTAQPHGAFYDRKRGWSVMQVDLVVRCLAPIDLKEQLLDRYSLQTAASAVSREVTFLNSGSRDVYVHARAGDRSLDCDSGRRSTHNFRLQSGEEWPIKIDVDQNICFLSSHSTPRVSVGSLCTASAGTKVSLDESLPCFQN